jgi:DNA repair protein RadC
MMNDWFGFETSHPEGTLLVQEKGGRYRPARQAEILEAARTAALKLLPPGAACSRPTDAVEFLRLRMAGLQHEVFAALFLDIRNRVIAYEELFSGTIDQAAVYPREVVKRALHHNAAHIIFAHNHPSGQVGPSQADIAITAKLREALALLDIRVLDHLIVGASEFASLAERGLL